MTPVEDTRGAETFDQHIERGIALRGRQEFASAAEQFRSACALRPASVGARCELAFTHLKAGELEQARQIYLSVCDMDAAHAGALGGLAQICRQSGQLAEAQGYLERAVAADPERLALQCELATVLRDQSRFDAAEHVLNGVLNRDPRNWNALVGLGLLARQRGNHPASVVLFHRATDFYPQHTGLELELALSLRRAGRNTEASERYRTVLDREADNGAAAAGLAALLRESGDVSGALAVLRQAVERRPGDTALRMELATTLRQATLFDEAGAEYKKILSGPTRPWSALVGLALIARQRGDQAEALGLFQEALAQQPNHPGLLSELALTYRNLDRLDEAEHLYQQAAAADPNAPTPLRGLSLVALARGRFAAAVKLAESALALAPQDVEYQVHLASIYREAGRTKDAAAMVEQCLALAPNHIGAWIEKGVGLRVQQQRAAALAAFEHAATLDPARGLIEAAREHLALGQPERARGAYEQILQRAPADFAALLGLADLALLEADYERCIALCNSALLTYPNRVQPYRQKFRALIQLDRADEALALVKELQSRLPGAETDAACLEVFRTCGQRAEAQHILSQPRVVMAQGFGPWMENVLTRLAFYDFDGAATALNDPPPLRPYERSRLHYGQGMLADLTWRVEDAIQHFEQALQIHAADAGAHDHLARLHLLRADAAAAQHQLMASMQQNASALKLRGDSTNVSQSLIGQLLNELRLDQDLLGRLYALRDLSPAERVERLLEMVRSQPSATPPAMALMLALRQFGVFVTPSSTNSGSTTSIPRRIVQFWDQPQPPEIIARLMQGWAAAHPDYEYHRFDDVAARAYLAAHCPPEVLQAYLRAQHPAQASDLFRLAYLHREGGFYIDADDRCVGSLGSLARPGVHYVAYQEQYATLGNNFLGALPRDEVIGRALALAVEAMTAGDADTIWLATGPGLMTRAFAELLSAQGSSWRQWLGTRWILDRKELIEVAWPHAIAKYKRTRRGWLSDSFTGRRTEGRNQRAIAIL